MNEPQKAWLACLLDGEGCVTIQKTTKKSGHQPYYTPLLSVTQTDKRMVELAQRLAQVGGLSTSKN